MKLEQQVITLQQAKNLKEYGLNQNAQYTYYETKDDKIILSRTTGKGKKSYSAYNVAELGYMVSETIIGSSFWIRNFNGCHIQLLRGNDKIQFDGETEGEARAEMLIYLIENKVIEVSEINRRA